MFPDEPTHSECLFLFGR